MPDEKRPLKVFLCHASADKPKVRDLYRYLKRRGIQPWLDAEDLLPGQAWQVEIPKALEASDAFIICLSQASVDKEGYVQKEIKFALDRALEMPEGRIFIIPARLDECNVPRSLSTYQWVDLFEESGCDRLMRALKLRAAQLERGAIVQKSPDSILFQEQTLENVNKQEFRMFYDLSQHSQYVIPDADAEIVAKNILEATTRISWFSEIPDVKDESRVIEYATEGLEYYDPKEGKTLQHAFIVKGIKSILLKQRTIGQSVLRGVARTKVLPEMFIITVTQGIKSSVIRFDSDVLPAKIFDDFVNLTLKEIGVLDKNRNKEHNSTIDSEKLREETSVASENEKAVQPPPDVVKTPEKPPRKLKPEYIVAIIGAVATILAALIGVLPQYIKLPPEPTATLTTTLTVTKLFTQIPTATFTKLYLSKTPTPSITFTPLRNQTMTPTLTQTQALLGCSYSVQDKSGNYSIECTCGDITCFCRSKDPKFNKDYYYWQRNRKGVEDYFKELGGGCHN